MATVAVVHPDLHMRGGAEDVCLHALDALQGDHDLTLLTLRGPDLPALNDYFRTEVDPDALSVDVVGRAGPALNARGQNALVSLQTALLGRAARRRRDEFDLLVSTKNELGLGAPAVQYVHSPQFVRADPALDGGDAVRRAYDGLCRPLAGVSGDYLRSDGVHLLANSDWTADLVERAYGAAAETVYPPVDAAKFPARPWGEREPGFLSVGRVGPSKNLLRNIDVVEAVRERGHDVHLHIVGPTTDDDYCEETRRRAAATDGVSFEGPVSHDELVELLATHRYGLHGRPYEHFGIAVAEFVVAGAVPFVPDSGGQREVVAGNEALCYDGAADAVEKIDRLLSDSAIEERVRTDLADAAGAFEAGRFGTEFRAAVEGALG